RSSRIDCVSRRVGTFAAASACAVRSTMRSWKEKSQRLRGPCSGVTKPAATKARMVARGTRSSRSTSATPYWFIARPMRGPLGLRLLARDRGSGLGALRRLARRGGGSLGFLRLRRAFPLEARAQRLHEVDHLRGRCGLLGERDLLAFHLLLDRGLDARTHLVLVL